MRDRTKHQVCSYEGSAYRTEFWDQGRDYEDAAERVALQHLLPPRGTRLVDIGGGYGRLMPLYAGYDEVVIFDYALSQLREAQNLWGAHGPDGRPRYRYVAGDFYRLPFTAGAFETVVMVRTLHHATDAHAVLRGVSDILRPGGTFVLEFANKRNLKAILRYLLRRQDWSPYERQPVEFVPLNFDFHPAWIEDLLAQEGLETDSRRAVSTFRVNLLKRLLPTGALVTLDALFQPLGNLLPLSPSVFLRCQTRETEPRQGPADLFRCPACGYPLQEQPGALICEKCSASVPVQDGIYNFKAVDGDHDKMSTA